MDDAPPPRSAGTLPQARLWPRSSDALHEELQSRPSGSEGDGRGGDAQAGPDHDLPRPGFSHDLCSPLYSQSGAEASPGFSSHLNRGPENFDPTRERKSEFWPAEVAIAR